MKRSTIITAAIVSFTALYFLSLPTLFLIERYQDEDFNFRFVYISTYGDQGSPRGEILMAQPYNSIYRPILDLSVNDQGELTLIGKLVLAFAYHYRETANSDDKYQELLTEAIAHTRG